MNITFFNKEVFAKPILQSFIITFLLFSGSYLTFGWWTDNYQHMFDTVMSGELTGYYLPAANNPFPEYMPGSAYIFNLLGSLYPIRWIALFLNGVLFVSIWTIYYNVLVYTNKIHWLSRFFLLCFFSFLFFESVVLYHMVRVTMFAGVASFCYLLNNESEKYFPKRNIYYFFLFVIAIWIRGNVQLFVLGFMFFTFLIHRKSIKPLLPYFAVLLFFFSYYAYFSTYYTDDLHHYFLYNLEFKLHFVGDYKPSLNFSNNLDSLKYLAAKHDILADEVNLTPEFYERIGAFTNYSRFSFQHFQYAIATFKRAMLENIYFLVADIILMVSYVLFGGTKLKYFKIKTLLLFTFFYLTILSICFLKMENRFLVPFQVLFLLTIVFVHKPNFIYVRKYSLFFSSFVVGIILFSSVYVHDKISMQKKNHEVFHKLFENLKNHFEDDVVVYNTVLLTWGKPHEVFYQKQYFKDFYIYNYYTFHLSDFYKPYLESVCNCEIKGLNEFYNFLLEKEESIILVDRVARVDVLEEYLYRVNGENFLFKKLDVELIDSSQTHDNYFYNNLQAFELKRPKKL